MKAYLIYHPEEAQRNQRFIQMFQEKGKNYDLEFSLCLIDEYRKKPLPELVLNRTRDASVSRYYEEQGIGVSHSAPIVELGNDKFKTLQWFAQKLPKRVTKEGTWCPRTQVVEPDAWPFAPENLSSQQIIKAVNGHGGNQVFLGNDPGWAEALQGKRCIIQERIDSNSQDLRVYVVGGRLYDCVLRTGKDDFRSNYSLGGSVSQYVLTVEQKKYINQFLNCFAPGELGMAGIDFILDREGRLVFNELEEMVGSRMLYQCTNRDIVHDYIQFLHDFWAK